MVCSYAEPLSTVNDLEIDRGCKCYGKYGPFLRHYFFIAMKIEAVHLGNSSMYTGCSSTYLHRDCVNSSSSASVALTGFIAP